jgi:hypothetical protein
MHVPEYRAVDEANHSEVEAPQLACFRLFDASDQATQTLISFPPCCFVAAGVAAADMMVSELTAAKCILCSQVSGTSGYCVATPPCASPTSSFSTGPLPSIDAMPLNNADAQSEVVSSHGQPAVVPGQWFLGKVTEWRATLPEWKQHQRVWKVSCRSHSARPPHSICTFDNFTFEDWTLLNTRVEFHLLLHGYSKGCADTPSAFSTEHFSHYYRVFFGIQLDINNYGFNKLSELAELINDVVAFRGAEVYIEPLLADSTGFMRFAELTVDHRRARLRRIDAGDLKFTLPHRNATNAPTGPIHPLDTTHLY